MRRALSERGFAALAFDHRYFGESGGAAATVRESTARRSRTSAPRWRRCAILPARAICRWLPSASVPARVTWRRAVAEEPGFLAFAGIAGFYSDSDTGVDRSFAGRASSAVGRRSASGARQELRETIPAVAPDGGDVGMPLREAYEFYGTPRGAVSNYVNGYAVQSFAYTIPFHAIGPARDINVPTLVVHSENALAPPLARQFIAGLRAPHRELWLVSSGPD